MPVEQRIGVLHAGSVFQPMCGTGRPGCGRQARAPSPASTPRQARGAFLRMLEQQLHAQADAQQRLLQLRNQLDRGPLPRSRAMASAAAPTPGSSTRGAAAITRRIAADLAARAEPLERELQRGEIGAAAVDDGHIARRSQHALGARQSRPSRRSAGRSARPTPLKQASIMWWVFSPRTDQVQRAAEAVGQRAEEMRHQFGRQAPTCSRPKRPSKTK